MLSVNDLRHRLLSLDGRGYPGYRETHGSFSFGYFTLHIDHVQSDPYAPPSRLRVQMPLAEAGYPAAMLASRGRRVSLADFLARQFAATIRRMDSRQIAIDAGQQTVLERTGAAVSHQDVELRFTARLPAAGRRILGREAARLLA